MPLNPYRLSSSGHWDEEKGEWVEGFCYDSFPGGVFREWKDGKSITKVQCQLCHPLWADNEKPDPNCKACNGTGMRKWPGEEVDNSKE